MNPSLLAAGAIFLTLCMSCNLFPGPQPTPSPTPIHGATSPTPSPTLATPVITVPHATPSPFPTPTPRPTATPRPTPTPTGAGSVGIPNGDFETGTYAHWTSSDTAFGTQPSDLEAVNANGLYLGTPYSDYHGQFAASSYLPNRDAGARGTLTSDEFNVSKRYLEFLYTGMQNGQIYVEVTVNGTAVKHFEMDNPSTQFRRASLDLGAYFGRKARISVVDASATKPHGYIEVDDFYLIDTPTVAPQ